MNFSETVLTFKCEGQQLIGVLCLPADTCRLGLLIVVGGPQYRVGSHRHFVQLSRAAACGGYPAVRFDLRGMGDAQGELRTFEDVHEDIHAAIDAFAVKVPDLRGVVLMGLCDGASAALMYAGSPASDRRVMGLILLNPWVRSDETLAKTRVRHYYRDRLAQREFWLKLLQGRVAWAAVQGLWRNVKLAAGRPSSSDEASTKPLEPFQDRMLRSWQTFPGPILLMLSGKDYTAKEFEQVCNTNPSWKRGLKREQVRRVDFPDADHTLSTSTARVAMEQACIAWMRSIDATHVNSGNSKEGQQCHI